MNTYTYRDARRQRLNDALAAIPVEPSDLRTALETELAALQTDDWTVTDHTFLAAAADVLWNLSVPLIVAMTNDPVLIALQEAILVPEEAVLGGPHDGSRPPGDYLEDVRAAVGNEVTFNDLVQTGHRLWLQLPEDQRYPYDDVGVLLPVRLETLFDEPGSPFNDHPTQWKLSLRVVPDEASICRDNTFVSPQESKALAAFWQAVRQPGDFDPSWLDGAKAEVEWRKFCSQVTPPRAAWLVANLEIELLENEVLVRPPDGMPEGPQHNRVGGMPPEMHIYAIARTPELGTILEPIGRLPMDPDSRIDSNALELPLPRSLDPERQRWWSNWETAKQVGLGGEWPLPEGMTPDTLEAIYVAGIGDETPQAHFQAQVDAGEMGVLHLGDPTNSVHGQASAGLGTDDVEWLSIARRRLAGRIHPDQATLPAVGGELVLQLTGDPAGLPFFPGADSWNQTRDSHRMVEALWPVLWGNWLRELWHTGDDLYRVSSWAHNNLYPEGPLMPLRISDQPYGVLPVTSLEDWEVREPIDIPSGQQGRIEMTMARALFRLCGEWQGKVQKKRSVVGKTTEEFIDLLGQEAVSRGYQTRQFIEAGAWTFSYRELLDLGPQYRQQVEDMYRQASDVLGLPLEELYLTSRRTRANRLPLVQPTRMFIAEPEESPEDVNRLLRLVEFMRQETFFEDETVWRNLGAIFEELGGRRRGLPDSLLIRLLVYAAHVAGIMEHRGVEEGFAQPMFEEVLDRQKNAAFRIARELIRPEWQVEATHPITGENYFHVQIPPERLADLERALRATLDSASHRIDPWITGFAWQRLKEHSSSPRHAHRLGVYGWVDGPFSGSTGPTDAGLLHTPSFNQTLAALILRDKFISSRRATATNLGGDNPWEMKITAARVRLAEEIAEEVRLGFHIYEVVGRQVENILGTHQAVKELRTDMRYAMRPERSDPNEVCNGQRALVGLLKNGNPEAEVRSSDLRFGADGLQDDPAFPLTVEQRDRLKLLFLALDTYGDLLMADGVIQLVNRQPERAAEAMDAAAGFSRPPAFEFIRTPPSGYLLESIVLAALPYVSVTDLGANPHPISLADPSVASFLEDRLGNAWSWTAHSQDDGSFLGEVTLAELGFTASETLALSEQFLCDLAQRRLGLPQVYIREDHNRAWLVRDIQGNLLGAVSLVELNMTSEELARLDEAALHERLRREAGAAGDATVEEAPPGDPILWAAIDGSGALLGLATPAILGITPEEAQSMEPDELHKRIRLQLGRSQVIIQPPRQQALARQLVSALGSRPAAGRDFTPAEGGQQAVDAAIYTELSERYDLLVDSCKQLVDDLANAIDDPQRARLLRQALVWGAAPVSNPADQEALYAALLGSELPLNSPVLAGLAQRAAETLTARLDAASKPADLSALAGAIAGLASPNSRLTILACWGQAELLATTGLQIDQPQPTLDEDWLTVVAAARADLARLEAVQLEINPALDAWTSSPGDPWRTGDDNIIQQNLSLRESGLIEKMKMPRFAAAYGIPPAWEGEKVAVGMIDTFNESIPMPQRSTMAAFGFNAPAARPQQAILLAVPPRFRQRLDDDLLWQIIQETRQLAHARTARIEDLGEWQAMFPTIWMKATGPLRAQLGPYPLFE